MSSRNEHSCPWCAGPADLVKGVYLEALYPDSLMCRACGRRTLHCTCQRPTGTPMTEAELRWAWGK